MTGQMSLDLSADYDDAHPGRLAPFADYGMTFGEFNECATWCAEHPEATRWMVRRIAEINDDEHRLASVRLDVEPVLKKRAREWGLDGGTYRGVDHNLTANLARYLMATRPHLKIRIRAQARDSLKNATPAA